jgi:hypothetical protein
VRRTPLALGGGPIVVLRSCNKGERGWGRGSLSEGGQRIVGRSVDERRGSIDKGREVIIIIREFNDLGAQCRLDERGDGRLP